MNKVRITAMRQTAKAEKQNVGCCFAQTENNGACIGF